MWLTTSDVYLSQGLTSPYKVNQLTPSHQMQANSNHQNALLSSNEFNKCSTTVCGWAQKQRSCSPCSSALIFERSNRIRKRSAYDALIFSRNSKPLSPGPPQDHPCRPVVARPVSGQRRLPYQRVSADVSEK